MKVGTIPFPREFGPGAKGIDCKAVKRALAVALGSPSGMSLKSLTFAKPAQTALVAFKTKHGLLADPVYTLEAHQALRPSFDEYGASLMAKMTNRLAAIAQRDAYVAAWEWAIAHNRLNIYDEVRPIPEGLPPFETTTLIRTDCSGESEILADWEHLSDPSGLGFNGQGNCHEPGARLLTTDLRWVAAGDVQIGDELWAFDADLNDGVGRGRARRFRRSTVVRSEPAMKNCVRVFLDSGESLVCSHDHPWLSSTLRSNPVGWTTADQLLTAPELVRPFIPWRSETSYEAGWLAGMFDGEGWVTRAANREMRSSQVGVTQVVGPTATRLVEVCQRYGSFHVKIRQPRTPGGDQVYIDSNGGGALAAAEFLGRIRPERLIARFELGGLTLNRRHPARVVRIEQVGLREVASIQTTTGTYIAEGFAVHNTGSILVHGTKVTAAQAQHGDMIVYRAGIWDNYGHHVVTILEVIGGGDFRVGSNGHQNDPNKYLHSTMLAAQTAMGYPLATFVRWLPAIV